MDLGWLSGFDWTMALGSFLVAIVVGLTGMGGGALMTPMLVTFFGVSPLAAVSSDLVASAVMKPIGSAVHYRQGTINMRLVAWLCVGSV
ncbi:TSUP family transporter, partial [Actinomadura adrarensis]